MPEDRSLSALIRPELLAIQPYPPGKPIEEVERELGIAEAVKLASNENCLGPSPKAIAAARGALERGVHLYPDGGWFYLRRRLAELHKVAPDQVHVGSGSTEIIQHLCWVLLGPGREAVSSQGSFVLYPMAVAAASGTSVAAPLDGDERHDLAAMAARITAATRLVIIANPNNPTGTYVARAALERFLAAVPDHVVVVLDEAYFEYVEASDYPDGSEHLRRDRPLVVLRTFSKAYGLAGMRVGYALGPPELLAAVDRVRSPFNVSGLAQAMALAALDDHEHVRRSRQHNRAELAFLAAELGRRGFRVTPSVANFVLVDLGLPGEEAFARLLRRGVIVRPMRAYGFPGRVRVSVGTRAENERFLAALAALAP